MSFLFKKKWMLQNYPDVTNFFLLFCYLMINHKSISIFWLCDTFLYKKKHSNDHTKKTSTNQLLHLNDGHFFVSCVVS